MFGSDGYISNGNIENYISGLETGKGIFDWLKYIVGVGAVVAPPPFDAGLAAGAIGFAAGSDMYQSTITELLRIQATGGGAIITFGFFGTISVRPQ